MIMDEYIGMNLYHTPSITRVPTGDEALHLLKTGLRFNLIITSINLGETHIQKFVESLRSEKSHIPIILLAFDELEIEEFKKFNDLSMFDHVFLWQGDFRILLAIIKLVEDSFNVDHDTAQMGVPAILLVEDNLHFYSSYLPIIYKEVMEHSQNLLSDSLNMPHRLLRMRARPKIIHCLTFEDAWDAYLKYEDHLLGVITDVEFLYKGKKNSDAGKKLTLKIKKRRPEIPVIMQSFQQENAQVAEDLGVSFIRKDSPTLLHKLRLFMRHNFGFGDFVFRNPDGVEIERAKNLSSLEEKLHQIPEESLIFHSERDHFSTWFKARTEFELAAKFKPRKVPDYKNLEELRQDIINSLRDFRREQVKGVVVDFDPLKSDTFGYFAKIGNGSLGGKARGLAFINRLVERKNLNNMFDGILITTPPTVVLTTDIFDRFLDDNNLRDFAHETEDDKELQRRFLNAEIDNETKGYLHSLLTQINYPLAIRSSSLLEDLQFQPFAGMYETCMIVNNHPDIEVRMAILLESIKRVYISTFLSCTQLYFKSTSYRLEEEKMAVIIQQVSGAKHGSRFYPELSGVARSYNYYPVGPMQASDGVANVALGLGKTVVDGYKSLRFCPKYPLHLQQYGTIEDVLETSQKDFFALNLEPDAKDSNHDLNFEPQLYSLKHSEQDGTLYAVGSVYSADNNAIYDGLSRSGPKIVTFAPILKHNLFPLSDILTLLLDIGERGMGRPVEIEFSVNLSTPKPEPKQFNLLQVRPMVLNHELEELEIHDIKEDDTICHSNTVMGMGKIDDICDILVVDFDKFTRADSRKVADQVGKLNAKLQSKGISYILIGVGRWGTADPWLGIPVAWAQITGAKVIVETSFKDIKVTPSQGAHFFQNITSHRIGYFTVNPEKEEGFLDWNWLLDQKPKQKMSLVRHLHLPKPLIVKMNGRKNRGVIYKPGISTNKSSV